MAQERGFVPLEATPMSELVDLQKDIRERRNAGRLTMATTTLGAVGCAAVAFTAEGAAVHAADAGVITSILFTWAHHNRVRFDNVGLKALQQEIARRRAKKLP